MSTKRTADGKLWITENGRWRPASEQEDQASQQGAGSAFAESLGSDLSDIRDIGLILHDQLASTRFRKPGTVDKALSGMAQRSEQMELIHRFNPQARAMAMVADPLNMLPPWAAAQTTKQLVRKGAKETGGTMAQRVTQQVDDAASASRFADDSAGASRVDMAKLTPEQRGPLWNWIADEFLNPRPLSKEQRSGLELGDQVGFNWLPGQRDGNNLLVAGVKSHPILSGAFDGILQANRIRYEGLWLRAIGSDALEFSRDELGRRMDDIGRGMDGLAERIGNSKIPSELAGDINRLRKIEPDLDELLRSGLKDELENVILSGTELMGIRSSLNRLSSQLWTGAAPNPLRAQRVDELIDGLDLVIRKKLGKHNSDAWDVMRQQWANSKMLEHKGVITKDGTIDPGVIDNLLRGSGRTGNKAYIRNSTDFVKDAATNEALQFTRVANLFGDNLANSGTATRTYIQKLASGEWKGVLQTIALKSYLERIAVKNITPESAAKLELIEDAL